jgi:arylsulfatase
MLPFLKGEVDEAPRKEIFYFDAGANLNAIRYENWKVHFTIMEGDISQAYRKSPSWPYIINLRADPYEVSPDSRMYVKWYAENMWLFVPAQRFAGEFLATFQKYPPQTGSSLSIDKVVQQMASPPSTH